MKPVNTLAIVFAVLLIILGFVLFIVPPQPGTAGPFTGQNSLRMKLVSSDNVPLENVRVELIDLNSNQVVSTQTASEDGTVNFEGVNPETDYAVTVISGSNEHGTQVRTTSVVSAVSDSTGTNSSPRVLEVSNQTVREVVASTETSLRVTVLDSSNRTPLSNAQIQLTQNNQTVSNTTTAPTFIFSTVSPGTSSLSISLTGYVTYVQSVTIAQGSNRLTVNLLRLNDDLSGTTDTDSGTSTSDNSDNVNDSQINNSDNSQDTGTNQDGTQVTKFSLLFAVTNTETSQPVQNAIVTLKNSVNQPMDEKTVDSQGKGSFTDLNAGNYSLIAFKDGYSLDTKQVTLNVSTTATVVSLRIAPSGISSDSSTGSMRFVIVKDSDSSPLSGANISVTGNNVLKCSGVSNAQGQYTCTDLNQNVSYSATVTLQDYNPKTETFTLGTSDNLTIRLTSTSQQSGNTAAQLTVSVKDSSSNQAISGASVTLNSGSSTGPQVGSTQTSASDGTVTFTGLTSGTTYYANASKSGYTSSFSAAPVVAGSNTSTVFLTASSPQPSNTATLNVSVTCGGTPASSVSLSLCPSGQACASGTTDGSGNYTFSNIATGSYNINASKTGCNAITNQAMTVNAGANSYVVTMTQEVQSPNASADLVIYQWGNSEMRISGALVEFLNASQTVVASGTTSAQGTVVVTGLTSGTSYTLRISASGYNTYTNSVNINNAGVNYLGDGALTPSG
ncbi:MAG: carboxypeptidase regulatory-like domain-containing protein [Candidatus Diapherotrites archaeon]|nr:carboxypeptidase regulatory-like domain-containing protein [Candidatus Diapherotrites archaeon]